MNTRATTYVFSPKVVSELQCTDFRNITKFTLYLQTFGRSQLFEYHAGKGRMVQLNPDAIVSSEEVDR